jgi:hypothetical protein
MLRIFKLLIPAGRVWAYFTKKGQEGRVKSFGVSYPGTLPNQLLHLITDNTEYN